MYEYLQGELIEKAPAHIIIDNNGIGFFINISLHTYSGLPEKGSCKIYLHQVIREDANILFGFINNTEREIFRHLISVSGIGANTARIILSSMTPEETVASISEENVANLQSIKGIGGKTAQRIIVDLKDKISKGIKTEELFSSESNTIKEEALSALVALGFGKKQAEKVIGNLLSQKSGLNVEDIVKQALKLL